MSSNTSNNRPRILLIGANGQVGWELVQTLSTLGELTATTRSGSSPVVANCRPLDLTDAETKAEMAKLFNEQLYVFHHTQGIIGHFFWTLRMGSGWDPRPTDDFPHGRQLEGTSAFKSFDDYPFKVWSLLELAELGIATRLDAPMDGACDGQPEAPRTDKV